MRLAIYLLFLLSGFVALIYEGIWTRYLKLFLGHSSYGQIITLMTFMGGIGLGSFLAAKYLKRIKNPFLAYAIIEFALAIAALLFHSTYGTLTGFYFEHAELFSKFFWVGKAVQVFLCLLLTFPFATLLGLTYPLIAAGMMRHTGDGGKQSLPTLYFINSLGGAVGILVTSYFFIAQFGTSGTLLVAAMGNAVVGGGFYLISKRSVNTVATSTTEKQPERSTEPKIPNKTIKLWLAVSLGTGFASFIYEVGWIRLLSLIMGSSTHSFDVMISAFILGLAFGGLFASRLIRKPGSDITKVMATVQILMGCFAVISLFMYRPLFDAVRSSHSLIMRTEEAYAFYSIYKYLMALVLMFPASFCAGITLPLITFFLISQTRNEKYTGLVYGWNTIGSIMGAVVAGMLLMPILQLKWTIFTGAALDIALGFALLLSIKTLTPKLLIHRRLAYSIAAACIIPAAFISFDNALLSRGYYRNTSTSLVAPETLSYKDGRTASIATIRTGNFTSLKTNGKSDGAIFTGDTKPTNGLKRDEATVAQLAALPMMTTSGDYNAAIIGMGTGMTLHYLLSDERLQEVDLIEIEPTVIKVAENFRPRNERCFTDERVNYVIDDAKSYFYGNKKEYDIIISEPSNPWVSGVSSLFTKEFYNHTKSFLKPGGVFVQWVHTYEFSDDLMMSILAALNQFEEYEIYQVHENRSDLMILASDRPINANHLDLLAKHSTFDEEIAEFGEKLANLGPKNFVVSAKTLSAVLDDCHMMANSDYFPYVEQHAEKAFYLRKRVGIFEEYQNSYVRFGELFDPKREAQFRTDNQKLGFQPASTPGANFLRDALAGSSADSDWEFLATQLLNQTNHLFSSGQWHQHHLVGQFFEKLNEFENNTNLSKRMEFLKAISKNDQVDIKSHLDQIIRHAELKELESPRWKRTLTVCVSKYGNSEHIAKWKKILSGSKNVSPFEVANFKRAIALGDELNRIQTETLPVSLKP